MPLRVVNDVLGVYKKRIKWAFYEEGFQPWALVGGTGYVGYDSWRVKGGPMRGQGCLIEVPQNSLKFKYRAGHFFAAVVWVEKEIYLLIGPLGSASARSQASKGAKNELKMTKMTIQRKKITKVIRIDKQAPFLD